MENLKQFHVFFWSVMYMHVHVGLAYRSKLDAKRMVHSLRNKYLHMLGLMLHPSVL